MEYFTHWINFSNTHFKTCREKEFFRCEFPTFFISLMFNLITTIKYNLQQITLYLINFMSPDGMQEKYNSCNTRISSMIRVVTFFSNKNYQNKIALTESSIRMYFLKLYQWRIKRSRGWHLLCIGKFAIFLCKIDPKNVQKMY